MFEITITVEGITMTIVANTPVIIGPYIHPIAPTTSQTANWVSAHDSPTRVDASVTTQVDMEVGAASGEEPMDTS